MAAAQEQFERARAFLMENGRLLERARFTYHFESGRRNEVLTALAAYQNDDGGFGNALEPDVRLPASSPLATTVALQILRSVGATKTTRMVKEAIAYLLEKYNPDGEAWLSVPPEVNDYPHAFWWTWPTIAGRHPELPFYANPHAEIVAHFWHYKELVPPELLAELTAVSTTYLNQLANTEIDRHSFSCYLYWLKSDNVPDGAKTAVTQKLAQAIPHTVATNPEAWVGYDLQPIEVADSPTAPFAAELQKHIAANLDHLLNGQGLDGAWSPAWDWSALDADAWAQAQQEWQSVLTLRALVLLRKNGRL